MQVTAALGAVALLAFAPPLFGRTILIPLDAQPIDPARLVAFGLHTVSDGPLPASLVVEGKGRELASQLLDDGIIMLAAPAVLCGDPKDRK